MYSWKELIKIPSGTILHDGEYLGMRYLIMRGPASLCAYLGVPANHPVALQDYDDIDVRVHGGFTYKSRPGDTFQPADCIWFGWDYAHAGDATFFDIANYDEMKWTEDLVLEDIQKAVPEMQAFMERVETPPSAPV